MTNFQGLSEMKWHPMSSSKASRKTSSCFIDFVRLMSTIINHEHMVRSNCNATETVMTSAIIDHRCKKKPASLLLRVRVRLLRLIGLFLCFNAQSERNNEMNVSPTRNSSPTRASPFPLTKF